MQSDVFSDTRCEREGGWWGGGEGKEGEKREKVRESGREKRRKCEMRRGNDGRAVRRGEGGRAMLGGREGLEGKKANERGRGELEDSDVREREGGD